MLTDQRNRIAGMFAKFRVRECATGRKTLKTTRLRTESTCGWRAGYKMGNKATVMLFRVVDGLILVLIIVHGQRRKRMKSVDSQINQKEF